MANINRRVWKNGKVTYRALVRVKGRPPQSASFDRLTDARQWASQIEADLRAGRHLENPQSTRRTVAELIDRYVAEVLPQKSSSSQRNQAQQLGWWHKRLGDVVLTELTPAIIAGCRDELAREKTPRGTRRAPASVKRYLMALSHALTLASKEWEWIPANPMEKVSKPREPAGRVRLLSEDERLRLLTECRKRNPALYPVVMTGLYTGMRLEEIMSLRWEQVDLERRRIYLSDPENVKNRERRQVPMVAPLVKALEEWRDRQRGIGKARVAPKAFVFPSEKVPGKPIDLRKPWETARAHAGLDNFRFHDTRHATASYLAMSGASLAEIAEVLGHKTLSMVKRYAHLTDSHTAEVMDRMAEKFGSVEAEEEGADGEVEGGVETKEGTAGEREAREEATGEEAAGRPEERTEIRGADETEQTGKTGEPVEANGSESPSAE